MGDVQTYYDMMKTTGKTDDEALKLTKQKFKLTKLKVSPSGRLASDAVEPDPANKKEPPKEPEPEEEPPEDVPEPDAQVGQGRAERPGTGQGTRKPGKAAGGPQNAKQAMSKTA
jgi:hypothetical protein